MELTTILGTVIAVIGVLGGMYFKEVPFSNLANPAAIFIILVGTVGAVLNAFPGDDAKKVPALFGRVFLGDKRAMSNIELINLFVEYSSITRKDGMLALEGKIKDITDPFLKRAMSMMFSGQNNEYIESVLSADIEAMEQRHNANAGVFSQAGAYAPTLGVLGAVIGLIAALANMDDTEALGHAISGAFMATVYGIFTGYVLWHPFANKLKRKSKAEVLTRSLIVDGVLLLVEGASPINVKEKLISYLSQAEKTKFFPDKEE